jgi:hypothetical protein
MIDEAGKLFRKGVHIGDMVEGNIQLLPDHKKFHAAVTRWKRESVEIAEMAPVESIAVKPLTEEQLLKRDSQGMTAEAQNDAKKSRDIYKDDVDFATRNNIPQPPKKNPQFGDKTPDFVDWLHRYRHDEYVSRYGVKGKGKVPIIRTNPDTGAEEVTGYREVDMAIRKTHLTEELQTDSGLAQDMSWDA